MSEPRFKIRVADIEDKTSIYELLVESVENANLTREEQARQYRVLDKNITRSIKDKLTTVIISKEVIIGVSVASITSIMATLMYFVIKEEYRYTKASILLMHNTAYKQLVGKDIYVKDIKYGSRKILDELVKDKLYRVNKDKIKQVSRLV